MKIGIKIPILFFLIYFSITELPPLLNAMEDGKLTEISFGVLYKGDRSEMEKRYKKLENYFNEKQIHLEIRYFKDPQEIDNLIEEMKKGNIDIAGELTPLDYIESKDYLIPIVRTIWNGRDFYYGIILVKESAKHVRSLKDLKGKTIALSNKSSVSGFIYPQAKFFKYGLNLKEERKPGSSYICYKNALSAKNVLGELLNEGSEVVAGAVPQFLYQKAIKEDESIKKRLRLLSGGRLGPIKNGVFVCSKDLPEEIANRLREVLVNLTEEPPPNFFDDWNGFQGWLIWDDGDYDGLIRAKDMPSPTEKDIQKYLIIVGIVVLFISGLFVFRLMRKGEG
jgi:phosphonate transport system substrate-binding protein